MTTETLPTEPTFMLRGRDAAADEALITYHRLAKDLGADSATLAETEQKIEAFRAFPVSVVPGREKAGSAPGSSLPKPEPEKAPEKPAAKAQG